jgi:hypothetical protein
MEILDTDFNVIEQGIIHDVGCTCFLHGDNEYNKDVLVDGNVDVDTTRLTRRTFTTNLLNPGGIWSPRSDYSGTFYTDRIIRLSRGIRYGPGAVEVVPIGTFLIDRADVAVERNMSLVVLSGTDLWKKLSKSKFARAKSWDVGTPVNTVITEMAEPGGITRFNLDPLLSRTESGRELIKKRSVEQGDNRGEALAELCKDKGLDIYFDTLGRLTTQDFRAPGDTAVVYTYDPEANNNLITAKVAYSDENLYNSVMVLGTKDKDNIIVSRVRDTDPTSPTNVDRIGERVFLYESEDIGDQDDADTVAEQLFYKHVLINEDVTLEVICNPAYEGNDVIRARESEFSQIDSNYRLRAFTVPMSTTRQTLRMMREIRL